MHQVCPDLHNRVQGAPIDLHNRVQGAQTHLDYGAPVIRPWAWLRSSGRWMRGPRLHTHLHLLLRGLLLLLPLPLLRGGLHPHLHLKLQGLLLLLLPLSCGGLHLQGREGERKGQPGTACLPRCPPPSQAYNGPQLHRCMQTSCTYNPKLPTPHPPPHPLKPKPQPPHSLLPPYPLKPRP